MIFVIGSPFSFLKFSYTKKECNKAALALASEAVSSNFDFVRLEECPPYICHSFRLIPFNKIFAIVSIKKNNKFVTTTLGIQLFIYFY